MLPIRQRESQKSLYAKNIYKQPIDVLTKTAEQITKNIPKPLNNPKNHHPLCPPRPLLSSPAVALPAFAKASAGSLPFPTRFAPLSACSSQSEGWGSVNLVSG